LLAALKFVAVLSASLFAGAALYINLAEHPARMVLDTRSAALHWAPSYKRATWLQAPLALLGLACGLAVWLHGESTGWLFAALLLGAVVPFTLVVIRPTNKALLDVGRDLSSPETRELLTRWGRLHATRTALSLVATGVYLWSLIA
jgi:hypothetical protein